jgi:hypothetical protein
MRFVIDYFDEYRQVRREFDETRRVYHAAGAKAGHSVNNRGSCEPFPPEPLK